MNTQLSEKWAKINVVLIGTFYLISGIWEYLVGLTQEESIPPRVYFLLDVYRNYAQYFGTITLLVGIGVGIGFLFRLKFIRSLVLILAWWNLFTSPIIQIWWYIYAILIKKFSVTDSWLGLWLYTIILILILTLIRLYIIYILKVSKAGYIFLKKK